MAGPTLADIMDARQQLITVWQNCFTKWRKVEEVWLQDFKFQAVADAKKSYRNFAQAKVWGSVDGLVTNEPHVTVEPNGEGGVHKDKADKKEKWGEGVMKRAAVESGMLPPFRMAAMNLVLFGCAKGVLRWNETLWGERPSTKDELEAWEQEHRFLSPYVVEFPHPARILTPPNERIITLAIESASLYGWDVKARYPDLAGRVNKDKLVYEMIIYTTPEYVAIAVDGKLAESRLNGWGFVPYVQAYSGKGLEMSPTYPAASTAGNLSLGPAPEDLAVGLLDKCLDSIKALNSIMTAELYIAMAQAGITILTEGDVASLNVQLKSGVGSLAIQMPPGSMEPGKWHILEKPKLDPSLVELKRTAIEDIEYSTISGATQGIRQPGVSTATGLAIQVGQATKTFDMPMTELNHMAGRLLGFASRITEKKGETVRMAGIEGNAALFDDSHEWEVDFQAENEGERLRKEGNMRENFKLGLFGSERTLTEMGYPDAATILKERDKERMLNTPDALRQTWALAQAIAQKKMAQEGVAMPVVPEPVGPGTQPGNPALEQPPRGFTTLPGSPEEAAQAEQGMLQAPGAGIERAGMV